MKKTLILLTVLGTLMAPACTQRRHDGEEKKQNYIQSLKDSLAATTTQIDSCRANIDRLNQQLADGLQQFAVVENPREVEGYFILNSWRKRYPPTATGIVARMSKSEQLELVAFLRGGSFNRIEVSAVGNTVASAVVPHDQALNYTVDGNTTVMFDGAKADSIADFIANNELNKIELRFINNGRITGRTTLPDDTKNMIARTWGVAGARKELIKNEARTAMLQQKVNLLRSHIDK